MPSVVLINSILPPVLCLEPVCMEVMDYIHLAATNAYLRDQDKQQLRELLKPNPEVCTHKGRTEVLQHQIHTTRTLPIISNSLTICHLPNKSLLRNSCRRC